MQSSERDPQVFEQSYAAHRERLRAHLCRMTGDRYAAEDLLQETFLRAWQAPAWPDEAGWAPWLYRIATNLALNHRRASRLRSHEPLAAEPAAPDGAVEDPSRRLQQQERAELCRRLVAGLPTDQRRVVQLVYDAELGVNEVAAQLGIAEGTVKSRLHHARRQLFQRWRALDPEEDG